MKLLTYLQLTKQLSRRDFADMLREQVIFLNNHLVESFDTEVAEGNSIRIQLPDGETYTETVEQLPVNRPKLLLFNKPAGYVVSKKDRHNKTIYELLPSKYHKRYYIGRLDKDSTGLLLLSNDPALVDWYENPRNKIKKIYDVQIDKPFKSNHTKKVCKGIEVTDNGVLVTAKMKEKGEILKFEEVSYYRNDRGHYFVTVVLTEGKNRHIRRALSALGYKVKKLHRKIVGKHKLDKIKPGKWAEKKVR